MSQFFKSFQEKASVIGNLAKEYYNEGLEYATKELEKEQDLKQSKDQAEINSKHILIFAHKFGRCKSYLNAKRFRFEYFPYSSN